jgi:hypothetical protein
MDTTLIFRISNIIYNRSKTFSEKEYVNLMTNLYNINKMLDKQKWTHILPRDCIPSPWLQAFLLPPRGRRKEEEERRSQNEEMEWQSDPTSKTCVDVIKEKRMSQSSTSLPPPTQHIPCKGKTCPLCNYIGRDPQIFHMYQRDLEKKTEDELVQLCEVYDLETSGNTRDIIFRLLFTLKPEDLDSVLCWVDVTGAMLSSSVVFEN